MPNVIKAIEPLYESVRRPVVFSVLRDIVERFQLPNDLIVHYTGSNKAQYHYGSTMDGGETIRFEHEGRLNLEVIETYVENTALTMATRGYEHPPIFLDKSLGIEAKPIYTNNAVTLEFTYHAATRVDMDRWRSLMRAKVAEGMDGILHVLNYHYPVPLSILCILYELWVTREKLHGYNQDFEEYLDEYMTTNKTVITNTAGKGDTLCIKERMGQITGTCQFSDIPEEEKADFGAVWEVRFSYKFEYPVPIAVNISYPITIHNQLINPKLYSKNPIPRDVANYASYIVSAFKYGSAETKHFIEMDMPQEGLRSPFYDEWYPARVIPNLIPIITYLILIDLNEPTYLLDLNNLGSLELNPWFKSFLRKEKDHVNIYKKSVLYLELFVNQEPYTDYLYVTDDLKVYAKEPLDPRKTYHFRINVFKRLSALTPRAQESLADDTKIGPAIILLIDPNVNIPIDDVGINLNYIENFDNDYTSITGSTKEIGPPKLVNYLSIISARN